MAHWLLKSDPDTYAWPDLVKDRRTRWDGVTNPVALKNIRAMKPGDGLLVYHTGSERSVIGTAVVSSEPYPDPKGSDPKIVVVDIEARAALPRPVSLDEMRGEKALAGWDLLRLGRLSVVPVTDAQWNVVMAMAARPGR